MSSEESLIEDSSDDNSDHEHSSDSEREHSKTGKKGLLNIQFLGGVENSSVS